ncbi:type II toxin-antitoxin system RelE/ParE family toxin [Kaistella palustris]|uniref:type II toxin-antitoxin system RelE/ParE family toxin n=1 Tax=Kaistella palustris TaxID=493376 RepID=UPI000416A07E
MFPNKEICIFDKHSELKQKFDIELLPEAVEFLEKLDKKTSDKIYYNIKKSQFINDNELFKKLNEFIWEFRTLYSGKAYRLFSFWDKIDGKETLIVATHGILKKSQKTPTKEIKKAEEIRKQYLENKLKKR